jgi:hypothetical protein
MHLLLGGGRRGKKFRKGGRGGKGERSDILLQTALFFVVVVVVFCFTVQACKDFCSYRNAITDNKDFKMSTLFPSKWVTLVHPQTALCQTNRYNYLMGVCLFLP